MRHRPTDQQSDAFRRVGAGKRRDSQPNSAAVKMSIGFVAFHYPKPNFAMK